MKVEGDWISNPATQRVFDALDQTGLESFFVGGCVRNALLGQPVGDIDIATGVTPDAVISAAVAEGLRAIPTGYDHGTITVVSDGIAHEVTTFRRDVTTDGRRAVVEYGTDIAQDAARRDFTMNALYADRKGQIYDPLNGIEDLESRRVRFIGDANARIQEDYLRILRFFRFYAWYGDPTRGPDQDGLAACTTNIAGLESISAERIGAEILKLLSAPDPAPAVGAMSQSGVLSAVLPGADTAPLAPVVHLETGKPNPIRRLAALGGVDVSERLRLSKAQAKQLSQIRKALEEDVPKAALAYKFGTSVATDAATIRFAMLGQELPQNLHDEIHRGANSVFPIKAAELPELSGPELGIRLRELEARWVSSDFTLTKAQLLAG